MLTKISFHQKVLFSLCLAFAIGLWAHSFADSNTGFRGFDYLLHACDFLGKLFLNALKMVVIPLVLTSVICGVAQISSDQDFGRLGLKTVFF